MARALPALLFLAVCVGPAPASTRLDALVHGREPEVRVLLRALGPVDRAEVEGDGGLEVGTGASSRAAQRAVEVAWAKDGLLLDGRPVARDEVVLRPRKGLLHLLGRAYSGALVVTARKSHLRLVNRVPMENYVLGVLRGELPLPKVPTAAAAAQAVAVRSYAFHYLLKNAATPFDLDDTSRYQCYVGYAPAPQDDHLRDGVQETFGLYLEMGGEPLKAFFHSTCGGHTADADVGLAEDDLPPLKGVACDDCKNSKYYRWQITIPDDSIVKAAGLEGALTAIEIPSKGASGRAREVRITAGGKTRTVSAPRFRLAVGPSKLRSTLWFAIERTPKGVLFRGGGWGHGVGLCQMGAIGMATHGATFQKILKRYYPAATLLHAY